MGKLNDMALTVTEPSLATFTTGKMIANDGAAVSKMSPKAGPSSLDRASTFMDPPDRFGLSQGNSHRPSIRHCQNNIPKTAPLEVTRMRNSYH